MIIMDLYITMVILDDGLLHAFSLATFAKDSKSID